MAVNALAGLADAGLPSTTRDVISHNGLAMQAEVLVFDRHSAAERQPYCFDSGSVLTWDGRLDNRGELLATLHHSLPQETSDVAIVAAAFQRVEPSFSQETTWAIGRSTITRGPRA
jgi:hypothetical protein